MRSALPRRRCALRRSLRLTAQGKPLLSIVQEQRLCAAKAFEEESSQPTQAVPVQFADRQRLWYKEAVFYEVYVRAFCDSSGRYVSPLT